MEDKNILSKSKRSLFVMAALMTLNILIFLVLIWQMYQNFQTDSKNLDYFSELSKHQVKIVDIDRTLTMMMRTMILTKDIGWDEVYFDILRELDEEIAIIYRIASPEAIAHFDTLQGNLARLQDYETEALELGKQEKWEEAEEEIFGELYTDNKEVLVAGLVKMEEMLNDDLERAKADRTQKMYLQFIVMLVVIPLMIIAWLIGYTMVNRSQKAMINKNIEIGEQAVALKKLNIELEMHAHDMELANRKLEKKNKELDEFNYIASHDLQEPLRKIIAFGAILEADLDEVLDEESRENLTYMVDGAGRLKNIINDLLEFSRSSRRKVEMYHFELDTWVVKTIDTLEISIEEAGAEVTKATFPRIYGSPSQIGRIFQNLISNAIKFSDNEHTVIELTAVEKETHWTFGVKDNGIGIEKQYCEQIFSPFKRLHGQGAYKGTGIGLAICSNIVDQHRGFIWVDSEFGEGSHFQFNIPKKGE
jgi:signal transduction histidine kinase